MRWIREAGRAIEAQEVIRLAVLPLAALGGKALASKQKEVASPRRRAVNDRTRAASGGCHSEAPWGRSPQCGTGEANVVNLALPARKGYVVLSWEGSQRGEHHASRGLPDPLNTVAPW